MSILTVCMVCTPHACPLPMNQKASMPSLCGAGNQPSASCILAKHSPNSTISPTLIIYFESQNICQGFAPSTVNPSYEFAAAQSVTPC